MDASGRVIERRVDEKNDPDLLRACRGAGGAGFGIITSFRFKHLPVAPREVVEVGLRFPWETMTENQFVALLTTYGDYWTTRGRDPDTWGLFALLGVGPRRHDGWLAMHIQFCQPDGKVDDLSVLREFLARFDKFQSRPYLLAASRVWNLCCKNGSASARVDDCINLSAYRGWKQPSPTAAAAMEHAPNTNPPT